LGRAALGNLLVLCQFGTLPADLTRANMGASPGRNAALKSL